MFIKDFYMWNTYHEFLKENGINYAEYVLSSHWKDVKTRYFFFRRSTWKCDACGVRDDLNIHHKTYERIGREEFSDLCLLCKICHNLVHEDYKDSRSKYTLREVTDKYINRFGNKIKSDARKIKERKQYNPKENQCEFKKANGRRCKGAKQKGYNVCGMHLHNKNQILVKRPK